MKNHKPVVAPAKQLHCLRSAVLLGTALGGVSAGAGPVWAQTACVTPAGCTNNGASNGLLVSAGTSVAALTNAVSGVITVNSGSYPGISNSGTVGSLVNGGSISSTGSSGINNNNGTITTLVNTGSISASNANGISNSGTIGTLVDSGVITVSSSSYQGISNSGTIGMLARAGQSSSASGQSIVNNAGTTISNSAGTSVGNTGTIKTEAGIGVYNGFTGTSITNNGTINGLEPTNNVNETTAIAAGIYNDNGGNITSLTNGLSGIIEAGGTIPYSPQNTSGYGIDNLGIIGTLTNSGTISSSASSQTGTLITAGIENNGTINALNNTGVISSSASSQGSSPITYGIDNNGTIVALTNSGTIQSGTGGDGIDNEGTGVINLLSNTGLITDGSGARGIVNNGTIGILNNGQTGTIIGSALAGISNENFISAINNSGLIQGTSDSGLLNGTGTISALNNSGTIEGVTNGVKNFATIGSLVNSGTIEATGAGGNGINNSSFNGSNTVIGTLLNTGTISATGAGGNGIYNSQSITTLANSGIINAGAGGYDIANTGDISTLANAGEVISANNQTFNNNSGNLLTDQANLSINNTGTIGLLISAGVYNSLTGVSITNNGSITANTATTTGPNAAVSVLTAGIYNDQSGSLALSNQGNINTAQYGIYNAGTFTALTNSGTIAATNTGGSGIATTTGSTIVTLANSGLIASGAGGNGIENNGTINTFTNSGTLTGATDALYLSSPSMLGTFVNSGTVAGNIDNQSSQALNISGATGGNFGTLTGQNGTSGRIYSSQTGVNFISGNLLLNDNITAPTITNSGANILVNGNVTLFSPFSVSGGVLDVGDASHSSATLTSNVNVSGTGLLNGNGTIIGNVVNDSMVAPGTPMGTLSVTGNYTQNNDGTLTIGVSPSGSSQLDVTGTAQLSGALALNVSHQGSYNVDTPYVIVKSSTVSGSGLTYNLAAYQNTVNGGLANYLTAHIITNPTTVVLNLTPTPYAFSSGHVYAAGLYGQSSALQSALAAPLDPQGSSVSVADGYWLHGIGGFGSANGGDFNNKGFVAGRGFSLSPNTTIGGALSNVYTSSSNEGSSAGSTTVGGLAYGIYTQGPLTVAGSVGGGYIHNHTDRYLTGLGWQANSSSDGAYEGASARTQYNLLASNSPYFLAPYATASYLHSHIGAAQESNAGPLSLHYNSITINLAQMGGGARLGVNLPVQAGTFTLWGDLGGVGTLGNPRVGVTETLGGSTGRSSALVAPTGAFAPGVGVQFQGTTAWRVSTDWSGLFGGSTHSQNFALRLSAQW